MKPHVIVLLTLVVAGLAIPTSTASVGYDNGLAVFLTVPEGEYDIGSTLTVGIWVYKLGDPYDAPVINFEVGYSYYARLVNVTHVGMGEFESTFTIEESDLDYVSVVRLYVEAREGTTYYADEATASASISMPKLAIDLKLPDPADQFPAPGQLVEFEARTTFRGEPVDPNPGTLLVKMVDSKGKEFELMTERVRDGVYEGGCTISSFQKESETYTISASAEYTHHSTTQTAVTTLDLWSDFFSVFVDVIEASIHGCEVGVFALDKQGKPLVDAKIILNITYFDDAMELMSIRVSDYTDLEGKAGFREPFTAVGQDETHVNLLGTVTYNGLSQTFEGNIRIKKPQLKPPTGYGFNVLTLSEEPVVPDTPSVVESFAYLSGDPLPDTPVYIYVMDQREVYYSGNITTNSQGRFEFVLNVPETAGYLGSQGRYVVAYYHVEWRPGYWDYDGVQIPVGDPSLRYFTESNQHPRTKMEVAPYQPGGEVTVMLSDREANGESERAVVYWGIGSVDDCEDIHHRDAPEEWSSWVECELPHLQAAPCSWDEEAEAYITTFVYPEFLPVDTEIYVVGVLTLISGMDAEVRVALEEGLTVDLPPRLVVPTSAMPSVAAGVVTVNGTASDDASLESIQYRIDGGTWKGATGTTEWEFEIDTTALPHGPHHLEIRGYDGVQYSEVTNISFSADQPPSVTIIQPEEGSKYIGEVELWGFSDDDDRVHYIEVKIDQGAWYKCYGIGNWTYELTSDEMTLGNHTVKVRSFDGYHYSEVQEVSFFIVEEEKSDMTTYILGLVIAVIIAVVLAAFIVQRRRSARSDRRSFQAPQAYSVQPDRGGRPTMAGLAGRGGAGAPQGLLVEVGDSKLRLRWYPPTNTGGGPLTGYRVYRGEHRESVVHLRDLPPNLTSYEDTGLVNGNSYYYAVSTLLSGMEGDMTDTVQGIPVGPPSYPVYPGGQVGESSILLSWRPPSRSGGSAIRGFVVLKGTTPEALKVLAELGYEFTFEDTEVVKGQTYYYAIIATNDAGWGEPTQLLIAKFE